MRISQQLAILTLCAMAVIIAFAGSSFYCVGLLREGHDKASRTASTLENTEEICYHAAYASAVQKNYLITGRAESREIYQNEIEMAKQLVGKMQKQLQNSGEEEQLFDKFAERLTERLNSLEATIKIYEAKGQAPAFERIRQGAGLALMAQTIAAANQLTGFEHNRLNEEKRVVDINAKNTELAIIFGSLIAILIIGISNYLFSRNLSNAVINLLRASKNVARERFESLVDIRSNNELGDLGRAFNTVAGHLRRKSEELDSATSQMSETEKELAESLNQFDILSTELKHLAAFVDESAQGLELSDKHQKNLENELKELVSLSDMLGVSLHQILDFSREIRVGAESLDKRCSDLNRELGQFTDKAERAKASVDRLWSVLPETKELVTQLETLDSELAVLEVVSDITNAKGASAGGDEVAVIRDRLKTTRQNLSRIRSNLNINVSRIQQMAREALDASSGFAGVLRGSSHPLSALSTETKRLLQMTLTSRGELINVDRLFKRQVNGLDELGKCYSLLNGAIARDKDFAARVKSRMRSLPLDAEPKTGLRSSQGRSEFVIDMTSAQD